MREGNDVTASPAPGVASAATAQRCPASVDELEELLSRPSAALVDDLAQVDGDLLVLGVGGKMGPTLARLAQRATPGRRVVGVARFTDPSVRERLERWGIETIAADLLDRGALAALPALPNIVYAAGHKFGAAGNLPLTWAMNTGVPAAVAEIFCRSRIVAFSTGNVYPLTAADGSGATEATPPAPVGEYAQSCLGRERMFEYHSQRHATPGRLLRLNYAIDLRYGVLLDIGSKVLRGQPVDVTMGHVNVIWQGDANAQALRCLRHCTTPTAPLNCAGPEVLSVRWLAEAFGRRLDRPVTITGREAPTALLSDAAPAWSLFGAPSVAPAQMIDWVADWLQSGRPTYDKPTKFEVRDGSF